MLILTEPNKIRLSLALHNIQFLINYNIVSKLYRCEVYVKRLCIINAFNLIKSTFENGGVLYCAGNGGSSSDSEHIVGELLKSFKKSRVVDSQTQSNLLALGEDGEYLLSK